MAFDSVPTLTVTVSRSGVELAISQVYSLIPTVAIAAAVLFTYTRAAADLFAALAN